MSSSSFLLNTFIPENAEVEVEVEVEVEFEVEVRVVEVPVVEVVFELRGLERGRGRAEEIVDVIVMLYGFIPTGRRINAHTTVSGTEVVFLSAH